MQVQVAVLLFCWGVFVMFTLLLSHYHRCSAQYWVIFGVQSAACIGAEALFIHLVNVCFVTSGAWACCAPW